MSDRDSCSMHWQQLRQWFDSPLGQSLQAHEAHHLRGVLPNLYGTVAAQLGHIGRLDFMDSCIAPTRILLDDHATSEDGCRVRGKPEELPLDSKSADVVLLPHTLDFCEDPHQVLREVSRVLRPEGHVVIIGFNARRSSPETVLPSAYNGEDFRHGVEGASRLLLRRQADSRPVAA